MKLNTKNIIGGVLVIAGLYYIYKYYQSKKTSNQVSPTEGLDIPAKPTSIFPINKGSRGTKVKEIQTILISIDKNILPKKGADGIFGTETETGLNKILGKKSIDSQSDLDNLKQIRDKNLFPYVKPIERKASVLIGNFPIFTK